jgi:ribosomal protein S18 acetylase RimI-like enzyme
VSIQITAMTISDYQDAYALWKSTEGMGLSSADTREGIEAFLTRNPGLSLVARLDRQLIGTVLCGHDGRRGYLHHLAVDRQHRGRGLGRRLVEMCLTRLASIGIQKCHIFLHRDNEQGRHFWQKVGWKERTELRIMSKDIASQEQGH